MIGRKLRAARVLRGLTSEDMAGRMGCTRQQISAFERQNSVTTRTLERYAQLLGFSVSEIYDLGSASSDPVPTSGAGAPG